MQSYTSGKQVQVAICDSSNSALLNIRASANYGNVTVVFIKKGVHLIMNDKTDTAGMAGAFFYPLS